MKYTIVNAKAGQKLDVLPLLKFPEDFHGSTRVDQLVKFGDSFVSLIGKSSDELPKDGVIILEHHFDAVTVNPYFGREALQPFLDRQDKGIIILCKTSNPGSGEFQDLVWEKVAQNVAKEWNKNNNCLLVVGATYPEELKKVRKIVGEMTLLVPGIGTQGADVAKTVKAGLNSKKAGIIVNSSRGIIFADNPRAEAQKLKDQINQYR